MTDALSLGKPPPATASSDGGWTAGRPSEDSSGGRKDFQGFHEALGEGWLWPLQAWRESRGL